MTQHTYRVPVCWEVVGFVYVSASSQTEAADLAQDSQEIPKDTIRVNGSYQVDFESVEKR